MSKELSNLTFVGGPACGRRYRVSKALPRYEHEDDLGCIHEYVVEPSRVRGWGWSAIHVGIVEVRS